MKNKGYLSFLILLVMTGILFTTGCKSEGCTDPTAENFDEDARKDDGTCLYNDNATEYIDEGGNVTRVIDNGEGTGTMTWTNDKTWVLDGLVFVNEGHTLTIEAGTVIKGQSGQGSDASALVVARGGVIEAVGTPSNPIIFTYEGDDVTTNTDVPAGTRGQWGGLIILGKASTNTVPAEKSIEGIPTTEDRGVYGGTIDNDYSGTVKYVSIRHGGTDIGAGNEINGLTMGAVGSATVIEHIEVAYNADDGFEWFGGTVNCKWLVSALNGDDAFDYDEGWRGKGQFWFVIQDENEGDRAGEHDGGTDPETGNPYATPNIWNATYIGRGEVEGKRTITFRDNAGGQYHNSIFTEFGKGIDIEILSSGEDSYDRFVAGELALANNIFWNVNGNDANAIFAISPGSGVSLGDSTNAADDVKSSFLDAGNQVVDPGLSISRANDGGLDPIPTNVAATSGAIAPADSWYTPATYKGAFGTTNWATGWTLLDEYGFF